MANYYTRGVMEQRNIALTKEHYILLEMTGAEFEGDPVENVLDKLANCDNPNPIVGRYYIFWPESINLDLGDAIEIANLHDLIDAVEAERLDQRWGGCMLEDLLRDILDYNPQEAFLQIDYSHSCSKMRPDGFGGGLLVVTRTQSFDLNTYNLVRGADKDGNILLNIPSPTNFDESVKC